MTFSDGLLVILIHCSTCNFAYEPHTFNLLSPCHNHQLKCSGACFMYVGEI